MSKLFNVKEGRSIRVKTWQERRVAELLAFAGNVITATAGLFLIYLFFLIVYIFAPKSWL